ncbi:MAG: hypothetical protein LBK66_10025 [Spirochaetaceae bacterium]|jgi:U3 small nucleolar ribonucleoprotein component|nr:hypothetical protein [Spirochaetaceae bacterium]
MPLLQVNEFPQDLYEKISMAAEKENRTISQQTVFLIKESLCQEEANRERRRMLVKKCRNRSIPDEAKTIDVAKLIREGRK